jgi:arylformamidase
VRNSIATAVLLVGSCLFLTQSPAAQQATTKSEAKSAWIDISAPIDPKVIPVYPGDAGIKLDFPLDFRKGDKLTLSSYSFGAHTGTHIDAPLHFIRDGATIDKLPLDLFIGPARVIDCSPDALAIDAAELNKHQWRDAKRILFRTRNSRNHWMSDPNFHKDFTYIAPDAAQLLADAGVQLVAIDYISAEKFGAAEPKTHYTLLGKNIPIIEGVDLSNVTAGDYDLIILPLKVPGHEAAPARAVLKKR